MWSDIEHTSANTKTNKRKTAQSTTSSAVLFQSQELIYVSTWDSKKKYGQVNCLEQRLKTEGKRKRDNDINRNISNSKSENKNVNCELRSRSKTKK